MRVRRGWGGRWPRDRCNVHIDEPVRLEQVTRGGQVWLLGRLWWSWQAGDEAGISRRIHIAAAFGITPETLWRWRQAYDREGIAGLAPVKPGPKGAWKLTDEVISQIVALDAQGHTQAHIARTAGVSTFSVRQVLRERQTAATQSTPAEPADDTDSRDTAGAADVEVDVEGLEVVPAPIPRTGERQAARYGQLQQATPVLSQDRQLPLAGLLLALPGLEATGLLHIAEATYGRLTNGFYGLRGMLMTLVLLALLRNPVRRVPPGWCPRTSDGSLLLTGPRPYPSTDPPTPRNSILTWISGLEVVLRSGGSAWGEGEAQSAVVEPGDG